MLQPDLLEAGEAAAVVGAILWLAQTILEALQPGELDAWLRRAGLAGAIGELKSEVERMKTVVNGVGGRAVGNDPLAGCLARVKELMYDADDVVDEIDYCRLQQQAEGVITVPTIELEGMVGDGAGQVDANTGLMLAPASELEGMAGDINMHGAEQAGTSASNTVRKNRSKAWDHFRIKGDPTKAECIYCAALIKVGDGTSGLHKHFRSCKKKRSGSAIEETPNRPSAGDNVQNDVTISVNDSESRKRMRNEDSVATTTTPWNKANFCKRIHEIAHELQKSRVSVTNKYLTDSVANFDQYQNNSNSHTIVRTSGSRPGKVYGRYEDKYDIMSVLEAAKSDNITVLPIVGIVGVGKTTLAKLIYNDLLVKNQFERIWVWVSNIFDEVRVTREILDVVTLSSHEFGSPCNRKSYEGVCNYTKLQEILKKHMACQTKKFLLVLDYVNDSMHDSHWKDLLDALGSSCIKGNVVIMTARNLSIAQRLGTVKPVKLGALKDKDLWLLFKACVIDDNNYEERLDIGRQISAKLKGNPLAVESAAEMLRKKPTLGNWKSIIRQGVWESLQLHGGIVTTLKISYYQLPYQLQQCFLFCSIFPNGHQFHIDDLVSMWISLGFVKSTEIGRDYFNALVNLCLLEQVNPKLNKKIYVMCGMMHEFARLISRTEFATTNGLECEVVLPTVRHLLIQTDSAYRIDEDGTIIHNKNFQEKLHSITSSVRSLRTLILIGLSDRFFQFQYFQTFISNLVNCTHLRCLKLENKGIDDSLMTISLSKFYHLEVLDVGSLATVGMSDLVSMRHLVMTDGACGASTPTWLGTFTCLRTIHLDSFEGWETLPSLEGLLFLTKLKLSNMHVTEVLIPSLEELVLIDMPELKRCSCSSVRDLNSSLSVLEIKECCELMIFPLFESCEKIEIEPKSWLPNVNKLTIHNCPHLMVSNPIPPSGFCKLSIKDVSTLPTMEGSSNGELEIEFSAYWSSIDFLDDKNLSFHNLKTITQLQIAGCRNLLSISLQGLWQLVSLKRLEIRYFKEVFLLDVPSTQSLEDMANVDLDALPSLDYLCIRDCGITGKCLSSILQHVRGLEELILIDCEQITGILMEGGENSFPNLTLAPRASSQGNQDSASTRSCSDKLLRIPSNLVPSLKNMCIENPWVKYQVNEDCFSRFTSLEELILADYRENGRWLLPCSLGLLAIICCPSLETLQPCFPGDLTRLTVLDVLGLSGLKSLHLHSCTALEELKIRCCESLDALEGVQSLLSLRYLDVCQCPLLPQRLESISTQGYELCPRLERLRIDDPSFLTKPFCKHLTSLQCLELEVDQDDEVINATGLTSEQDAALQLLTSLQQLRFQYYNDLSELPMGLHSLSSLKRLEIRYCPSISRLPERGLPSSLEELEVCYCSEELTEQCRALATSKLTVIIDKQR